MKNDKGKWLARVDNVKRVQKLREALQVRYENQAKTRYPVGASYGRLTVTGHLKGEDGWTVLCVCTCGQSKNVRLPNQMRRGLVTSCGCLRAETTKMKRKRKRSVDYYNFIFMCRSYTYGASDRKLSFSLTKSQMFKLFKSDCALCGVPPQPRMLRGRCKDRFYVCNGIDRIDSTRGYSIDNVQACCTQCNYAKRSMTNEAFFAWAERVHRYRTASASASAL